MTNAALVAVLCERIEARAGAGILRVGIDGVDGAGKTTLADALGIALGERGHAVIRASVDGFHNPRAVRYWLGKDSPEGFYRDSYQLELLRSVLLDPLSPGGAGIYRSAMFDVRTDASVEVPERIAIEPSILVFDGIFLHRPELREYWDLSIFLDMPFAVSYARMAKRDGSDPDPAAPSNRRYFEGQKLYFAECQPHERADVLVDYADLDDPRIVRG